MSPPVYFLWGLLRTMICLKINLASFDNQKRKITNETAAIPPAMLAATFAGMDCPDGLRRQADGN
jgi:hypothetical protein